ncbi:MAG: hypothetical protein ACXVI9_12800 [Mucilaginibacter sp.]
MNFRLNFHTSVTSNLEPHEIIANIQFELKNKKYIGKYVTDSSVSFADNPWRLRWNFEPYMLDGGEFVISEGPSNEKLVTLNYHWRYLPFLFTYALLLFFLIRDKVYEGIWFFSIFYAIVVPIDIIRSKREAKKLLAVVLETHE